MQFKSIINYKSEMGLTTEKVSCSVVRINIIVKRKCFTLLEDQALKQVGMRSVLQERLPSPLRRSPKYHLGYLNNSKNPSRDLSELSWG